MTARWQTVPNCLHEARGTATGSSRGTLVTSAASANTKGSWTDIGNPTTFDYQAIFVQMFSTLTGDMVVDLGLSDGTNRWTIAADLRVPAGRGVRVGGSAIMLPLYVPVGSQISARVAADSASKNCSVHVTGASIGFGGMPGFSRLVSMYTPASSRGTDIEPTVANTKTSWVEITTGVTQPVNGLLVGVGPGGQLARAAGQNYLIDIGIGAAAAESVLLPNLSISLNEDFDVPMPCMLGPFPALVPASTRLAARAQSNVVTAGERKIDVALWGFVR